LFFFPITAKTTTTLTYLNSGEKADFQLKGGGAIFQEILPPADIDLSLTLHKV